jgi:hypothetical protein
VFDAVQENTTLYDDSCDPICRIACDKPKESYNLYKDVLLSDFVVCPHDTNIYHVWMG